MPPMSLCSLLVSLSALHLVIKVRKKNNADKTRGILANAWKEVEVALTLQIPTLLPEVVRDRLSIRATSGPDA